MELSILEARGDKVIQFVKGCQIPNSESLKEEYKIYGNWIIANVNADKILKVIYDFVDRQEDNSYLFLFLEVPCKLEEEKKIQKTKGNNVEHFHKNVYYRDGISKKSIKEILEPISDILIQDGLVTFGVGNHITKDEIGKYKYNEIKLFFESSMKDYDKIFEDNSIPINDERVSSWDFINPNNHGTCDAYTDENGKTIYDVIENLSTSDMFYKAEIRKEDSEVVKIEE